MGIFDSLKGDGKDTPFTKWANDTFGGPKGNQVFGLFSANKKPKAKQTTVKAKSPVYRNMAAPDTGDNRETGLPNYGRGATAEKAPADDTAPMDFASFMQQAAAALGGQTTTAPDLSSYDEQSATLKGNGAAADAKLKTMYDQLQASFKSDAGGIASGYDSTHNALAKNSNQASSAIDQGYDAASSDLTKQLKALGIGDALKTVVNKGNTLQEGEASALANVATNKGANLNHNDANKQSALDYNTNIGHAAGLEGTLQRATSQQNLASALAEVASARSTAAKQSTTTGPDSSDIASLAMQLMENSQANDPESTANVLKSTAAATAAAKAQASSQASADKSSYQQQQNSTQTMLKLITQGANLYPDDEASANAWVKQQAKALGIG